MTNGGRMAHDWFNRPLPANVAVGDGSWLYSSFAFLHFRGELPDAVTVGAHTGVYDGCHFELGPSGRVSIGDYCSIVGAIINTNGHVRIGDYTFVAHEVVIADDPFARPWKDSHAEASTTGIEIGENAWIGARAILVGGARVGDNAVVGAGAVVTEDVPPGAIAVGNPARIVGQTRRESRR